MRLGELNKKENNTKYYIKFVGEGNNYCAKDYTRNYSSLKDEMLIEIPNKIPYTASQIQRVILENKMYVIKKCYVDITKQRTVYLLEDYMHDTKN